MLARQNTEGRIYGMTFIDLKNKCVFNGSDLGKQYVANALMERCRIKPEKQQTENLKPAQSVMETDNSMNSKMNHAFYGEKESDLTPNNLQFRFLEELVRHNTLWKNLHQNYVRNRKGRKNEARICDCYLFK